MLKYIFTEYGTAQTAHAKDEIIYTEDEQAAHIAQYSLTLRAFEYCDRQYIFTYINESTTNTIGFLENHRSENPYAARINLITTANMLRCLSGVSNAEVISGNNSISDVQHYRFSDDAKSKIVDVMFVYSKDDSTEYLYSPSEKVDYFVDMYGNKIDFLQRQDGKYVLNITDKPIYAVRETQIDTFVRLIHNNGLINVSGYLSKANANSYAGIKVVNDKDKAVYFTQKMIDSDKSFSFDFRPKDDSWSYRIYIGNKNFKSVLITDNNFNPNMAAKIYVSSSDGAVSTINDFKNADNILIEVEEYTDSYKDYDIVVAGYFDKNLLTSKIFKKEEMNITEKGCKINIEKSEFMSCDSISFYVIYDFANLIPLSECIKLK